MLRHLWLRFRLPSLLVALTILASRALIGAARVLMSASGVMAVRLRPTPLLACSAISSAVALAPLHPALFRALLHVLLPELVRLMVLAWALRAEVLRCKVVKVVLVVWAVVVIVVVALLNLHALARESRRVMSPMRIREARNHRHRHAGRAISAGFPKVLFGTLVLELASAFRWSTWGILRLW